MHRASVDAIREGIDLESNEQELRSNDAVAESTRASIAVRCYVDIRDDVAAETDVPNGR